MARRKQQFMDQGSDTDSDDSQDDEPVDDLPDEDSEFKLHRGKKRSRDDAKEDATYGIWANESDEPKRSAGGIGNNNNKSNSKSSSSTTRRKDYLAGQSFVKAGGTSSTSLATKPDPIDNLSTALSIEPAREDEEDVAMDLNSSDSEQDQESGDEDQSILENDEDQDREEEEEVDQSDLAPVPGLHPTNPTNPQDQEEPVVEPAEDAAASSLGFAPRGIGARRGRGGIASGTRSGIGGGIGARGGIGSASKNVGMAMFSKSTSTLDSTSNPTTSTSEEPLRTGLGSKAGGGNTLIDSLRAELNGNPLSTTSTSNSTPQPTRQASPFIPPPPPTSSAPIASTSTSAPPAPRRSFLPSAPPVPSAKKAPLSRSEAAHFSSLRTSNSIGLKLLEKMGWSAADGGGLGKEGQGIVTPIGEGQKLRRKGEGIKGGERSKVSWEEEARRKGVSVKELQGKADAEEVGGEEKKERKKEWKGETKGERGQGKKREKKVRTEFKTYDEILKEAGEDGGYEQKELLVDLSGNALPDQTISSSLPAFGAGSADPTRLPELRHNLTLLTSTLSSSLRSLAKEGSGVVQRRAYLESEESRIRKGVEKQETKMKRLEGILRVVEKVKEVESECRELLGMLNEGEEVCECLEKFGDEFDELLGIYGEEYEELRLDEVVVGAITPICRRIFQSWDPLSNPSLSVSQLKRYRKHFLIDKHLPPSQNANGTVDLYGNGDEDSSNPSRRRQKEGERSMTAFESFMWTIWLPKIRSAINNDWTPSNPSPAVTLFSTWSPLLPAFLRDNILDQLILPKLSTSISDWSSSAYKRGAAPGLHTIVFPWLEVAGEERMQGLLEECKRRVRGWVKSGWKAKEGVPQGLEVWKEVISFLSFLRHYARLTEVV
ncbi:hypothetical protein JCM5353_006615 [Sporobolomyces roseus]